MNLQANNMSLFDTDGALDEKENDEQFKKGHGHDEHDCDDENCDHDHGHAKKKSRHDSRVNSIGCQEYGEMTQQSLSGLMRALSQVPEGKGLIMRIKGIFAVQGIKDKVAFHAVMDCTDEEMIGPWKPDEKRVCKLA